MAGSKNVLLVEDDPYIADIYVKKLKEAGLDVCHTENGFDSLALAEQHQPRVILLDVMVPGITGLELLKVFRTEPKYGCQKSIIILLSNISEEQVESAAEEFSADGYILKVAIQPSELARLVRSYFQDALID
jgi:CheY-like chemotaxis protein